MQLEEIRRLIASTEANIQDLNGRFGGERKPQTIFIQVTQPLHLPPTATGPLANAQLVFEEYDLLTEQLHRLQQEEERLVRMSSSQASSSLPGDSASSPAPSPSPYGYSLNTSVPLSWQGWDFCVSQGWQVGFRCNRPFITLRFRG